MSMNRTSIEWTELTWNPLRGCSHVSRGCEHCYAERMARRFVHAGFATEKGWTGRVELIESKLDGPLHRKKPSVIFVNSMSDTFHEKVPDEWLDRMFAVMALCPQHRFLVLTKRAKRMREYFGGDQPLNRVPKCFEVFMRQQHMGAAAWPGWPLPNVGLGVSVEDDSQLHRIEDLLPTPAACRMVSLEPLLGPVDLPRDWLMNRCPECGTYLRRGWTDCPEPDCDGRPSGGIDWVIVGGESGPGARPMPPEWPRAIREQCVSAGVPFFFKGWGAWASTFNNDTSHGAMPKYQDVPVGDGTHHRMFRVGKKAAGRLLDGRLWDQMPEGWG